MQDALDKIRHHRLAGALQPATVTLCPGPHHVEGLTLDPATDSNIAWESVDPRAPAVVTAGVAITGWSQDGSGAWSAPFPAAFQQQRGAAAADPNPEPARPFGVRQLWGPDGTRRKRQTLEGAVCGGVADYALGCSAFALPHGNGGGSMNLTASLPSEFPGFTANTSWPALHWNASTSVEAVFSRSGAWRRAACGVRRAFSPFCTTPGAATRLVSARPVLLHGWAERGEGKGGHKITGRSLRGVLHSRRCAYSRWTACNVLVGTPIGRTHRCRHAVDRGAVPGTVHGGRAGHIGHGRGDRPHGDLPCLARGQVDPHQRRADPQRGRHVPGC